MQHALIPGYLRPISRGDNVRLGKADDGGYIVPKTLCLNSEQLISMGINLDWSFEAAFLKLNPGCQVSCYDKSTTFGKAIFWGFSRFAYSPVSRRKSHLLAFLTPFRFSFFSKENVVLVQKFVGTTNSDEIISVDDVMSVCKKPHATFLKIDIEGSEYDVLERILAYHDKINAIAIEFHRVQDEPRFQILVRKTLEHFRLSHIHVNNAGGLNDKQHPHLLEITFVHKSLVGEEPVTSDETYRHPEDMANLPHLPDFLVAFDDSTP